MGSTDREVGDAPRRAAEPHAGPPGLVVESRRFHAEEVAVAELAVLLAAAVTFVQGGHEIVAGPLRVVCVMGDWSVHGGSVGVTSRTSQSVLDRGADLLRERVLVRSLGAGLAVELVQHGVERRRIRRRRGCTWGARPRGATWRRARDGDVALAPVHAHDVVHARRVALEDRLVSVCHAGDGFVEFLAE